MTANRLAIIIAALLATGSAWADAGNPRVYGTVINRTLAAFTGVCAEPTHLPCTVEVTIGEEGSICGPVHMKVTAGREEPALIMSLAPYRCITWNNLAEAAKAIDDWSQAPYHKEPIK